MTSTHADTYATALQPKAAWQFFQGTLQAAPPSTRRAYSQTLASMARYLQAHHLSLNDIGKEFGDRDHSTILHSLDKVESTMRSNPAFAEKVKEITTNINSKK